MFIYKNYNVYGLTFYVKFIGGLYMKRLLSFFAFILGLFILLMYAITPIYTTAQETEATIIYFGSESCSECAILESNPNAFAALENQGYSVKKYYIEDPTYMRLLRDYQFTYGVSMNEGQVPVVFVGDRYFTGNASILQAIENNTIQSISDSVAPLDLRSAPASDFSLVYFMLLGLVDGVNPCAIAMLLMFISLLGFSSNKRVLIQVSFTFILAIFLSYFLFGTVLYQFLSSFRYGKLLSTIVPWIIISVSLVLFILNFYDYLVTRKEQYGKVKNQLPSGIQRFNKKMMKYFTKKMDEGSPMLYVITFFIGLVISVTEFLCTGQAYMTAILHLIHFTEFYGRGIALLLIYNVIFVMPLIVISLIAIKTQSIVSVSAFFREKLHYIKLFNALVFLGILLYYLFLIF